MRKLMLGNEAFARGAYEAGVTVATAYPGTPSTEITENIAKYDEIYAEWSPNEKVALEVAIGSSMAGARSLCCMKHVGLNVAADPLFTVAYTGVNGGLVIIVADDPGMHSSQNEQDSRYYARSAGIPMLEPSDSNEASQFVKIAFELSEKYDTPILLRSNTRISHSQSLVELNERTNVPLKAYVKNIAKNVMMPGMARKRHVVMEKRMNQIAKDASNLPINKAEYNGDDVCVITNGVVYNYVKEAMPNASILKLGMVHPLPKDLIKEFTSKHKKTYIVEELEPIFEEQIKAMGIEVIGKEILSIQGEYSYNLIKEKVAGEDVLVVKQKPDLPMRPPVMCPGCPHRGFYYVVNKLKLVATGDIGCYTLGALPPLMGLDTCVCMGASISMAMGMEKARGTEFSKKLIAVIGDSTFYHSGMTGLVDMVYNGGTSTVVILDNSTTGMTGHQENPQTGLTIKGDIAPMVDIEGVVRAIGVKHVRSIDPFKIKELEAILKEETARDELSVIITKRPCVLLKKEYSKASLHIDDDACKKCGMCMKIGCPSIEHVDGKYKINSALCVGCGLCTRVCAFNAIKVGK